MEQEHKLNPLVSVICLCFNQRRFISEAIESVLAQTYKHIELIILDDASTDGSIDAIKEFEGHDGVSLHFNESNLGNCRSFNIGYEMSQGTFLIDLAGDDLLLPDRIQNGIDALLHSRAGIQFGNMEVIDEEGNFVRMYHKAGDHIPDGDIYKEVLGRHFIGGASMMIRREVLEQLGGYDEQLDYEDFDFWVRSSREFTYKYSPEVLVKKRLVKGSKGDRQLSFNSEQLRSTFMVCEKALDLNRSVQEHQALKKRILFEMRKAAETANLKLASDYLKLLNKVRAAIRASS